MKTLIVPSLLALTLAAGCKKGGSCEDVYNHTVSLLPDDMKQAIAGQKADAMATCEQLSPEARQCALDAKTMADLMKCPHDGAGGGKHHHGAEAASTHIAMGTIDAAGANALVPAALKDKIVFEQRTIDKTLGDEKATYTFAMPKGWTQESKSWAKLKPDDKGGFFSGMEISTDCDGECKPKAWEAIAEKNFFAERAKGTVVKDQKQPGSRLMIAAVDKNGVKTTDVVFAWWKDGEPRYHACVATLDDSIKDAAPAFEKACTAIAIDGTE